MQVFYFLIVLYIFTINKKPLQIVSIFYIIIAFLLSVFVGYFQYFYKVKKTPRIHIFLSIIKSLALFFLFLLLINPTLKSIELENTKPVLIILVDNSKSISFFKEENNVRDVLTFLKENSKLNRKFDVKEFYFGKTIKSEDSLTFTKSNTNIFNAIHESKVLYRNRISPIVMLTDGNQTIGNDYQFTIAKQSIYPLVFGDTSLYKDLIIKQLNVNKYSFVKNKFPVEVILNYDGKETVNTKFKISKNGKVVFRKRIQFSANENSKVITTHLTSTKEGLQYYKASVDKVNGEKNIKNNSKNFSIEVIDEQTKVLILSSFLHPDLGALKKAIEQNKQRSVDIININEFKNDLNGYQLIILYQPTVKFNNVINDIKQENLNYFLISGTNTDWSFINRKRLGFSKQFINKLELFAAKHNNGFLTFSQKNIGFEQFTPLKDKFGEISIKKEHQNLLYQNINGLLTEQPLLSTFEENNQKTAILFGEGIWKWRSNTFLNTSSFQDFDEFIGSLVQYMATNKKRNRLEVNVENLYPANAIISISAFYTDKNYKFDSRASLEISITNTVTKKGVKLPFSLANNSYQAEIENLPSGDYVYKVTVLNQKINSFGKFKITDYQIEEQFTNANTNKLQKLADKSNGKLFYKNQKEELLNELLDNKAYYTIQKSITKERQLIDWKWILFIIIFLFTSEWFTRKYFGKI